MLGIWFLVPDVAYPPLPVAELEISGGIGGLWTQLRRRIKLFLGIVI